MPKHNFKELKVWKKARMMTKEIYTLTNGFPETERFGITAQIRRAVVSISCNISEGAGRETNKDFNHFLNMAYGASNEVMNLLFLSMDLGFVSECDTIIKKFDELNKMIRGLQKTLN